MLRKNGNPEVYEDTKEAPKETKRARHHFNLSNDQMADVAEKIAKKQKERESK